MRYAQKRFFLASLVFIGVSLFAINANASCLYNHFGKKIKYLLSDESKINPWDDTNKILTGIWKREGFYELEHGERRCWKNTGGYVFVYMDKLRSQENAKKLKKSPYIKEPDFARCRSRKLGPHDWVKLYKTGTSGGYPFGPLCTFKDTYTAERKVPKAIMYDGHKTAYMVGQKGLINKFDIKSDVVAAWGEKMEGLHPKVEAAFSTSERWQFLFSGESYTLIDGYRKKKADGYPKKMKHHISGWPAKWKKVDAAFKATKNRAVLINGTDYLVLDTDKHQVYPGYPKQIWANWKLPGGWNNGIDSATDWDNGKVYLFKGGRYLRVDARNMKVDPGYGKAFSQQYWTRYKDNKH